MPTLNTDRIPTEMRALPRWVVATLEDRNSKKTKVPRQPRDPSQRASVTDPTTWADFETAHAVVKEGGAPMLGFVLGEGWVGIDLDECRHPDTGAVEPWAEAIITALDSYAERSVTGAGIHIICRGSLPTGRRRHGRIEMYDDGRYFVMTSDVHGVVKPVAERTAALAALHAEVFTKSDSTDNQRTVADKSTHIDDATVLARARTGASSAKFERLWSGDRTGYGSDSEADLALCGLLAYQTGDPTQIDRLFRQSGLMRPKWYDRADYRVKTLQKAVSGTRGKTGATRTAGGETSAGKGEAQSHATALVKLMETSGADFFRGTDGTLYVTVLTNRHQETMKVTGEAFRTHMSSALYRSTGQVPTASAVKDATAVLLERARQGDEHPVHVRIARTTDGIWLDLARPDWKTVKVTATGWSVVDTGDVRFRRPAGLSALPVPVSGSHDVMALLRELVNVKDERDLQLLIGWLLGALRGVGPYPILSVNGEQGSAKSSACRVLRRLIDPSAADLRTTPKEPRDLMVMANNGHILAFDNLSHIEDWFSDALCRMATGGGFSTRQLFTDDGEVIFTAQRPVIVNGITDIVTRPDLLSRAVVVTLEPIPTAERKLESHLNARFHALHPSILGALLDAVVMALRDETTMQLPGIPRMADSTTWVEAAAPALGWKPGEFCRLFTDNQQVAVENSLDGDALADGIRGLSLPWSGQAVELLNQLPDSEQKPKSAKALTNALRRKAPALRQVGIEVVIPKTRTGGKLLYQIRRVPVRPASTVPEKVRSLREHLTGRLNGTSPTDAECDGADEGHSDAQRVA